MHELTTVPGAPSLPGELLRRRGGEGGERTATGMSEESGRERGGGGDHRSITSLG